MATGGANTIGKAEEILPESEDRVGKGEERLARRCPQTANRWAPQKKKQHESVEVKLIFPGENRRRVDKKSVGRGATDSTKACLGRTMQQGAGGCHLRLEQEDELDSRSPVNSY